MSKPNELGRGALAHLELAALDVSITALQAAGHSIGDVTRNDDPKQQMAEAMFEIHAAMHSGVELNGRDREIVNQIKSLASQLSVRTSLGELLEVRGKVLQGG